MTGRRTCSRCTAAVCPSTRSNTWNLVRAASWTCIYKKNTAVVLNRASPPAEQQDVHSFLLNNMTNGGILELMMRYLKAVGQKFLEEWPRGLAAVVLEVYQTWRKHSSGLPNPLLRDCSNQHIRVNTQDYMNV